MARSRMSRDLISDDTDDDAEAAATASFPAEPEDDPLAASDLTPFARRTLAEQAAAKASFDETERRRMANDARTERDIRAQRGELAKKVRDVLAAHYKDEPLADDIVNRMMRRIEPVLAAGKEGNLRSRRIAMYSIPVAKPVAA